MRYGQITQVYASGGAQIWDLREERRYKADLRDIPRSERPRIGAVVSFELNGEMVSTSVKELSSAELPTDLQPLQPVREVPVIIEGAREDPSADVPQTGQTIERETT